MQAQVDEQPQYSPRNCLLFHIIKKEKGEDTDSIVINTVKEVMDIEILPNDLDRLHRTGNLKIRKKEMQIIAKFVRYNLRPDIFKNKKLLRGRVFFNYGKPHKRTYGKSKRSKRNVWTSDEEIFFKYGKNL